MMQFLSKSNLFANTLMAILFTFLAALAHPGAFAAPKYDLAITKLFPDEKEEGGQTNSCRQGEPCPFRLEIWNRGSDPFVGEIAAIDELPNGWNLLPFPYPADRICSQTGRTVTCETAGPVKLMPGDRLSWVVTLESPKVTVMQAPENCFRIEWKSSTPDLDRNNDERRCRPIVDVDVISPDYGRPFTIEQVVGATLMTEFGPYMDDLAGCLRPAPCDFDYLVWYKDKEGTTGIFEGQITVSAAFTNVDSARTRFEISSDTPDWKCKPTNVLFGNLAGFTCTSRQVTLAHSTALRLNIKARLVSDILMDYKTVYCASVSNTSDPQNGVVGTSGLDPLQKEMECGHRRMERMDRPPRLDFVRRNPTGCGADSGSDCYSELVFRNNGPNHFFGKLRVRTIIDGLDQVGLKAVAPLEFEMAKGLKVPAWRCDAPTAATWPDGRPRTGRQIDCDFDDLMLQSPDRVAEFPPPPFRLDFTHADIPQNKTRFTVCSEIWHETSQLFWSCDDYEVQRAP